MATDTDLELAPEKRPMTCKYGGLGRTGIVNLMFDPTYSAKGKDGFLNTRPTCWLSCMIQCLGHTDPLRRFFLGLFAS